jgi:protein-S-isoprenylcysteine O-methyltransferase Ste14
MMQATDFEFRNRWWLFGVIFGTGFLLLAFDHVPVGSRIADRLAGTVPLSEPRALHIVFGASALIMIVAALIRVWGSAYLGREVVHDHAVHSETLKADGPYRHLRNPLYLGNVLMSLALSIFAPLMG